MVRLPPDQTTLGKNECKSAVLYRNGEWNGLFVHSKSNSCPEGNEATVNVTSWRSEADTEADRQGMSLGKSNY